MLSTPEYYLSSEIAYRQDHLAQQYRRRGRRRVPRRRILRLPHRRPGIVTVA